MSPDRGQTVLIYELNQPIKVLFDDSEPPNQPLKLHLYNSTVALSEGMQYAESHPFLVDVLQACAVDAIVSRMDTGSHMEFITFPPVHSMSSLQFVRSYTLC